MSKYFLFQKIERQFSISCRTIVVMTVCSQYLRNVSKVFKLFPILITILSMWGLCAILTVTEVISPTNGARTDKNIELLYKADWFRFPYPCE